MAAGDGIVGFLHGGGLSHVAHTAMEGPTHVFIWEALSELRGCKEKRHEDWRGVRNN